MTRRFSLEQGKDKLMKESIYFFNAVETNIQPCVKPTNFKSYTVSYTKLSQNGRSVKHNLGVRETVHKVKVFAAQAQRPELKSPIPK